VSGDNNFSNNNEEDTASNNSLKKSSTLNDIQVNYRRVVFNSGELGNIDYCED